MGRKMEDFVPINEGKVGFYGCGPTVYNYAHIGNLRAYVFLDILDKTLAMLGYDIKHVMNITDVGHLTGDSDDGKDKMLKTAEERHQSVLEVAKFYTDAFMKDIDALNIRTPDVVCKATEHIQEMIDLIKQIEANGHTYMAGGNLYYDISTYEDYGKLANLNLDELKNIADHKNSAARSREKLNTGVPFIPAFNKDLTDRNRTSPFAFNGNRFEFRTERTIQNILANYGDNAQLIDVEQYQFYSNLANTPKHQVPDSFIKMNDADGALAQAFADKGVDVVFTGQGGDTLLATEINSDFAGYNIQNEFTFPWEQDLLYGPKGIKLVSVFSDTKIIDHIFSLRINQKDDPLKLWARQFFKPILPKELSDYTYRGDFFGLSISGLNDAIPSIKELFAEAYELTHHSIFLEKELDNCDVFSLQYKTYTQLCTKISIAVWLHSLFRNDE